MCLYANIYYAHTRKHNFDWNPIQEAQAHSEELETEDSKMPFRNFSNKLKIDWLLINVSSC